MRVISLGSGSSGNALLVEAGPRGRTKLLVDAGLSSRILIDRLQQISIHPKQLQGVLVTHEHIDHIIGLPVLMKRYGIAAIAAPATLAAVQQNIAFTGWPVEPVEEETLVGVAETGLLSAKRVLSEQKETFAISVRPITPLPGELPENGVILPAGERSQLPVKPVEIGTRRLIGDIEVVSFPVSHDAVAPAGYLLIAGGCRICVAIDSGEVTPTMLEAMHYADLLILESNHDRERLIRGPYPYALKQRILSDTGHLSNDQAADAVLKTWRADSVRWLWLSHLSRTNNTPKIALQSMIKRLEKAGANLAQIHISVSPPGMGGVWDSTQLWESPSLWEIPG
jgi:phosphoribosyl 1,2-cyclic phosphodiesterase